MQHTAAHHCALSCAVLVLIGVSGCDSGLGIGNECAISSECRADLQCLNEVCVPRCFADVECGEGFICDTNGACNLGPRSLGDACKVERDCGPHLTCALDDVDRDNDGFLEGNFCAAENPTGGTTIGNRCEAATDCRNGICQTGVCTQLCLRDEHCPEPFTCAALQKVETPFYFWGCLPRPN